MLEMSLNPNLKYWHFSLNLPWFCSDFNYKNSSINSEMQSCLICLSEPEPTRGTEAVIVTVVTVLVWWSSVHLSLPPSACVSHLFDLVFGLLQLVWFVGELQFGFSFSFLLQEHLTVLPLLPRLHTVVKHTLQKHTHTEFYTHQMSQKY